MYFLFILKLYCVRPVFDQLYCCGPGPVAPVPPSSSGRSDTDLEEQTLRMTSGKKVWPQIPFYQLH